MMINNIRVPGLIKRILPFLLTPIFLVFIFFLTFSFITVQGESMSPFIQSGQKLLYSKTFYGLRINDYWVRWKKIKKNDLVVFVNRENGNMLVKRCLATAGAPVNCIGTSLEVDGNSLFLANSDMSGYFRAFSAVPEDCIFVIGENIQSSVDSRDFGFVSTDDVVGKVVYISSIQGSYDNK